MCIRRFPRILFPRDLDTPLPNLIPLALRHRLQRLDLPGRVAAAAGHEDWALAIVVDR